MSKCQWPEKKRHASKEAALAHIRALYAAGKGNPDLGVYQCGKHWHVGHNAAHFRARIKRALRGRGRTSTTTRRKR